MQIQLRIQLQQDNGTPVITAVRIAPNFSVNRIDEAISFLNSIRMQRIVASFASIASGEVPLAPGTPPDIQI